MTKLEQEMLSAIQQAERYDEQQEAKNCAEVARKWILKAVFEDYQTYITRCFDDWLKENDKEV